MNMIKLDEFTKTVMEAQRKEAKELIDTIFEKGIKVVTVSAGGRQAVFRVEELSNEGIELMMVWERTFLEDSEKI
jgi:phosphoserine phosphatase